MRWIFLFAFLLPLSADEPATWTGRGGAVLFENPADLAAPGPWPVGARSLQVGRLSCEVLYPALRGSEEGAEPLRYDLRQYLPEDQRAKIPDADNPWQASNAYADLPLDGERGPYPAIVFIHGTSGFRTQSLAFMTHWASRGFVVIAADHPGIMLADAMQMEMGAAQSRDARALLAALQEPAGALAFLAGHVNPDLLAVAGHSAGGMALAGLGDVEGVRVLIPMAAGGSGGDVECTLVLGAMDDRVVPYRSQRRGFERTPGRARLVGLRDSGHLVFSDLVEIGKERGGLLAIARAAGVEMHPLYRAMIGFLATDGMGEGQLGAERGWPVICFATSAVLEEVLHGREDAGEALRRIMEVYDEVGELRSKEE